jgi:hypothetical protein
MKTYNNLKAGDYRLIDGELWTRVEAEGAEIASASPAAAPAV